MSLNEVSKNLRGRCSAAGLRCGQGCERFACELGEKAHFLGDDLVHDFPVDIRQPEIAPGVAIRQLLVIKAQQPQDRGVQIMHMHGFLGGGESEFIRRAVNVAALHSAARHPHREAVVVMIAAIDLALVRSGCRQLDRGRSAELSTPDDERIFEHPALLQVLQERADRLIALLREAAMIFLDVIMAVPWLARPVPDLHEPHATLDEAPRDEHLPALHAGAVEIADVLGLAANIECVRRIHLHAIRQFEGLHAGFELRVVLTAILVLVIEVLEKIKLSALLLGSDIRVPNILDQLIEFGVLRIDVRALIHTGQEPALPVLRFLDGIAAGAHGDEAGHVLVLASQSIRDPRTHARADHARLAAIHQKQRWLVIRHVRLHGADHANVIDRFRRLRKKLAYFDPAAAIFLKRKRRAKRRAGLALRVQVHRQFLAVIFRELRLRIECIHMRGAAIHEEMNHPFRLAGKLRRLRQERIQIRRIRGADPERLPKHAAQRQPAHPHSAAAKKIAAGEELVVEAR